MNIFSGIAGGFAIGVGVAGFLSYKSPLNIIPILIGILNILVAYSSYL